MKSERLRINSKESLASAITKLGKMFAEHKFLVLSIRIGKDRTLDQNALFFALYERISSMTQIGTEEDTRKYCKLHFGVPIMRRDDEGFRAGWDELLLHLPYEKKLELMGACALFGPDGFPVTRLFGRKQGVEYTDAIAAEFAQRGVYFGDLLDEGEK
jgi:hypothetical protein